MSAVPDAKVQASSYCPSEICQNKLRWKINKEYFNNRLRTVATLNAQRLKDDKVLQVLASKITNLLDKVVHNSIDDTVRKSVLLVEKDA